MKSLSQKNRIIIFSSTDGALLLFTVLVRVFYPHSPLFIWWLLAFIMVSYSVLAVLLSRKDLEVSVGGSFIVFYARRLIAKRNRRENAEGKANAEIAGEECIGARGEAAEKAAKQKKASKFVAPAGYILERADADGVPVEKLTAQDSANKDKVIYQIHGGGFVIPLNDIYRKTALKYSRAGGGMTVINLDYRIAPKVTHPAALEDTLTVWYWLVSQGYRPQDIIVAGDSAGGNLALAMVMKLRDKGELLPDSLICMSPWIDLLAKGKSYEENVYNDPIFGVSKGMSLEKTIEKQLKIKELYTKGVKDLADPYLSPAYGSYKDFPPMLVQCGSAEMLLSDSETAVQKAREAGAEVVFSVYKGMFHVFQTVGKSFAESKLAWYEIEMYLKHRLSVQAGQTK